MPLTYPLVVRGFTTTSGKHHFAFTANFQLFHRPFSLPSFSPFPFLPLYLYPYIFLSSPLFVLCTLYRPSLSGIVRVRKGAGRVVGRSHDCAVVLVEWTTLRLRGDNVLLRAGLYLEDEMGFRRVFSPTTVCIRLISFSFSFSVGRVRWIFFFFFFLKRPI